MANPVIVDLASLGRGGGGGKIFKGGSRFFAVGSAVSITWVTGLSRIMTGWWTNGTNGALTTNGQTFSTLNAAASGTSHPGGQIIAMWNNTTERNFGLPNVFIPKNTRLTLSNNGAALCWVVFYFFWVSDKDSLEIFGV